MPSETVTVAREASAYFATFCSASRHEKYVGGLDLLRVAAELAGVRPPPGATPCAPGPPAPPPARGRPAAAGRSRARGRAGPPAPPVVSDWSSPRIAAARSGSRPTSPSASRSLTASATSCCCAPSWMLRSSRRRSSSCAATSRFCAARRSSSRPRSSSVSPTLRKHQRGLRREVGDQPLLRRVHRVVRRHRDRERAEQLARDGGPRPCDRRRTACVGRRRPATSRPAGAPRRPAATRAPVSRRRPRPARAPSAAARRRRRRPPPIRSPNAASTSYGVERLPYTTRSANRRARREHRLEPDRDARPPPRTRAPVVECDPTNADDAADDQRVDGREEHRERREDHGLPQHDVDVVQAVAQDRDPDPDRARTST